MVHPGGDGDVGARQDADLGDLVGIGVLLVTRAECALRNAEGAGEAAEDDPLAIDAFRGVRRRDDDRVRLMLRKPALEQRGQLGQGACMGTLVLIVEFCCNYRGGVKCGADRGRERRCDR